MSGYRAKPPKGATLNHADPLAPSLALAYVANEGSGLKLYDSAGARTATRASGSTWASTVYGTAPYFGGSSATATFAALAAPTTFSAFVLLRGDAAPSGAASPTERFPVRFEESNDTCSFSWDHNNASFQQAFYLRQSGGTYKVAKFTTTLGANTWYAAGATFDGSNLRAYLNGKLETTTAATGVHTWSTSVAARLAFQSWPGYIACVYWWHNRVLTAADFRSLASAPFRPFRRRTLPVPLKPAGGAAANRLLNLRRRACA